MAKTLIKKSAIKFSENGPANKSEEKRTEVLKTYKIYIGGTVPRTESGRYYVASNAKNENWQMLPQFPERFPRCGGFQQEALWWLGRKGCIQPRTNIIQNSRNAGREGKAQFIEELMKQDSTKLQAENEVNLAIDRLIYYSGWCDKFQQLFSAVNPVASSHFNFSVPEPMGVVAAIAPQNDSLIGLVSS